MSDRLKDYHRTIADYYLRQPLCLDAPKNLRPNIRKLAELPYQQAQTGEYDGIEDTLTDFFFIHLKLRSLGLLSLTGDYDLLLPTVPESLRLIRAALKMSSHAITEDDTQLAGQLTGRLLSSSLPGTQKLLQGACIWRGSPWLKPTGTTLTTPVGFLLQTFEGHAGPVFSVAVAAEGKIVTGARDNIVKVWEQATGKLVHTMEGHTAPVKSVCVAKGGKVVSASGDHTVKIWDIESGRNLSTLKGHSGVVFAVAVTPDGKVISASADRTVKVWDIASGMLLRTLKGHFGWVTAVAVTSDGMIVSASKDLSLAVWDPDTGELLRRLRGHTGIIFKVVATQDGKAISASNDQTVRIWDIASGRLLRTLRGHKDSVTAVAATHDGKVVSGSNDKFMIWDIASGKLLNSQVFRIGFIFDLAMTSDGHLVSGSMDHTLRVWDLSPVKLKSATESFSGIINALAVTGSDKAVSGGTDNTLRVWDLDSGRMLGILEGNSDNVEAIVITPDDKALVTGGYEDFIKVWDISSGRLLQNIKIFGNSNLLCLDLTMDGKVVCPYPKEFNLKLGILDPDSGKFIRHMKELAHQRVIAAVKVASDGSIVSASVDYTVNVWDGVSGNLLHTLHSGNGYEHIKSTSVGLATTTDGKVLFVADNETLMVWDVASGKLLHEIEGNATGLKAARKKPVEKAVPWTLSNDLKWIWNLMFDKVPYGDNVKRIICDFSSSSGPIHSKQSPVRTARALAVSANGRIVSCAWNNKIILWDLTSSRFLASFTGDWQFLSCTVASDGRTIMASDAAGQVHFIKLVLPETLAN